MDHYTKSAADQQENNREEKWRWRVLDRNPEPEHIPAGKDQKPAFVQSDLF